MPAIYHWHSNKICTSNIFRKLFEAAKFQKRKAKNKNFTPGRMFDREKSPKLSEWTHVVWSTHSSAQSCANKQWVRISGARKKVKRYKKRRLLLRIAAKKLLWLKQQWPLCGPGAMPSQHCNTILLLILFLFSSIFCVRYCM